MSLNTLCLSSVFASCLKSGLNCSSSSSISKMPGVVSGNSFVSCILLLPDWQFMAYSKTDSSLMKLISYWSWSPRMSKMSLSWSFSLTTQGPSSFCFVDEHGERGKQELPGKSILSYLFIFSCSYYAVDVIISEKMQPAPHMSTALSYSFEARIISGGRYQRDTTWFDRLLLWDLTLDFGVCLCSTGSGRDRERPKSQIFTLQSELIIRFDGLISRCIILAEWMKFKAHRILYER